MSGEWSGYSNSSLLTIKQNCEDAIAGYQKHLDAISAELASREVKPGDRVRVIHKDLGGMATGVLINPQDSWLSLIESPYQEVTNWVLRDDAGKGHIFGVSSNLHRLEKIEP